MIILFRLCGLLGTADKVRKVAGLEDMPLVLEGSSELGPVKFCAVDQDIEKKLEDWSRQ